MEQPVVQEVKEPRVLKRKAGFYKYSPVRAGPWGLRREGGSSP